MSTEAESKIRGQSRHRDFSQGDQAAIQSSLARIMPEIGQRYWKLYYAAKAGNWALAKFQVGEIEELMDLGAIVRPKYEVELGKFIQDDLGNIKKSIENQDFAAFEEAFQLGTRNSNNYHKLFEKPIVWKLPSSAPPDLDLTPQNSSS